MPGLVTTCGHLTRYGHRSNSSQKVDENARRMVPGRTSVEAWIAEVSRLACCASYRQDLHVPTCGSFGFLPCVRAHSALVTKLHCPEVEKR